MTDKNPYRTLHARMSPPGAAWDEGFAAGRAAATPGPRCGNCGHVSFLAAATHPAAASPDERLREENERLRTMLGKVPQEQLARIMAAADRDGSPDA